jgi:hypothetical protein
LDEEVGGQITYINKYIYDLNSTLQSFVWKYSQGWSQKLYVWGQHIHYKKKF